MKRSKRIFCFILAKIIFFQIILCFNPLEVYGDTPTLEISSESALAIDLDSGQILYEKYSDLQLDSKLLSELMTVLLAIEKNPSGSFITASTNAAELSSSSVTLNSGVIYKSDDLISAAILTLSDAACTALYESVSADKTAFVELMNDKASSLGMSNTLFSDPCGKGSDISYTTARDIASFMVHAFNVEAFNENFRSNIRFIDTSINSKGFIKNTNDILWRYEYADGGVLKIPESGKISSITYSSNEGMNLLVISLNSSPESDVYIGDITKIFEYCFSTYEKQTLVYKGQNMHSITVSDENLSLIAANDVTYIAPKGSDNIANAEMQLIKNLSAPIEQGSYMGIIKYTLLDGTVINVTLLAKNSIYSSNSTLNDAISVLLANKDIVNLIIILLFIELLLIIFHIKNKTNIYIKKKKYKDSKKKITGRN